MSKEDIIRAWKDPEYRDSLSEEQRSQLPENPAGIIDLPDKEMESVAGGLYNSLFWCPTKSAICCEVNPVDYTKGVNTVAFTSN